MSSTIKQAIQALKSRVADAFAAVEAKGGTLPSTQDTANLPAAIASIPSGGEDLSWWLDYVGSTYYTYSSAVSGTEYMLGSPYLHKEPTDTVIYEANSALGSGFGYPLSNSNCLFNTYSAGYTKINYWSLRHSGTNLGGATVFRVFIPRENAKEIKISNGTTGEVYWKGSKFDEVAENALSKENLLRIIAVEISPSTTLYLSQYNYDLYSTDPDIVAALTEHSNITLASR